MCAILFLRVLLFYAIISVCGFVNTDTMLVSTPIPTQEPAASGARFLTGRTGGGGIAPSSNTKSGVQQERGSVKLRGRARVPGTRFVGVHLLPHPFTRATKRPSAPCKSLTMARCGQSIPTMESFSATSGGAQAEDSRPGRSARLRGQRSPTQHQPRLTRSPGRTHRAGHHCARLAPRPPEVRAVC